ncbi:hypothetical protein [Nocardioides sp.]|uniref:hypothetical protein n=1 Tax=Nocardioides sp. TaxID=35761 RepID=UPI0035ADF1B7
MRTTTLTIAGLLGLALLAPTTNATAAGETCRGEAATIVGTGQLVVGTEGRDVIVTGSSTVVSALGGDDLICVSEPVSAAHLLEVLAGEGNDFVDASSLTSGYSGRVELGAGADTFAGGGAADFVSAGYFPDPRDYNAQPGSDVDTDRVETGTGDDTVFSGSSGTANHDVVDVGAGDDRFYLGTSAAGGDAVLTGGDGDDPLSLPIGDSDVTLDQALGTLTSAQGTARVVGFEAVTVDAGSGKLTYRGTRGDDSLTVRSDGAPTVDIATDRGQDLLVIEPASVAEGSRIDLGRGVDRVVAATSAGSLELNLGFYQRLAIGGAKVASVSGIEDALLVAPEVTLVGSNADNDLSFAGCEGTLRGGHGRDTLRNVAQRFFASTSYSFDCTTRTTMDGGPDRDRLRGGQGPDRLRGQGGNDRLEGRGGRDKADGGQGLDRCTAEVERRCER